MEKHLSKILEGYQLFRKKYASGDCSIMQHLSNNGQKPQIMVVSCCDSRVDPALILQCDPGDLFVVRNVANIVPPYEKDEAHHGTSAALEFGICFLQVKYLILLGHSQCGGIQALCNKTDTLDNDFIGQWVSLVKTASIQTQQIDDYAKLALNKSFQHCLTFPWLQARIANGQLKVKLWFFDIQSGQIFAYSDAQQCYKPL